MSLLQSFDLWVEKKIINRCKLRKDKHFKKASEMVEENHSNLSEKQYSEVLEKVKIEINRVHKMAERSICRTGIIKAKYVTLATMSANIITVGCLGGFFSGSFLPFLSPLITGVVSIIINLLLIENTLDERVKGGYESVIESFLQQTNISISTNSTLHINQLLPDYSPSLKQDSNSKNETPMNDIGTPKIDFSLSLPITLQSPPDQKTVLATSPRHYSLTIHQ